MPAIHRALGVLVLTLWAISAHAELAMDGRIDFRDALADDSTLGIELGGWVPRERDYVADLFAEVERFAPGLLARATGAGPIHLYRTAGPSPSHPAAAWARRRHESSLIFRDDFFRAGRPNHLGVEYSYWLFVHEVAHLADPVDRLGQSAEWNDAVGPRLSAIEKLLAAKGMSLRDAMFALEDASAMQHGLPSIYAAISAHEALAETATAVYFQRVFEVPADLASVLNAGLFAPPTPSDTERARAYREAYAHYRKKDFRRAARTLDRALRDDPSFGMGYYLLGYVHTSAGDFARARVAWTEASQLVPASDTEITRELAQGLAFVTEKLGE